MKQSRLVWAAVPLAAVSMVVVPSGVATAAAATRYVATVGNDVDNDCLNAAQPCGTITHAVSQAAPGDTISIGQGSYPESVRVRISLTIAGAGTSKTRVTGAGTDPAITVDGSDSNTLPDVTVTDLAASGNAASDGIAVTAATLTLTHVAASQNHGSGLDAVSSTVHVDSSALDGNRDNGAELTSGDLTISRSTVNGNLDGGVLDESGTARVENSTLDANVGAGVVADSTGATATVTVTGSTIADTTPFTAGLPYGGGVLVFAGSAAVSESTLYDNTSFGMGVLDGGTGSISNSTISDTQAGPADDGLAGGLASTASAPTALTAVGTLDAANGTPDCAGTIDDGGYNLDGDGSCGLSATGSRSHAKADLGTLADNGGPTETVMPSVVSAARDAIPFGSAGCVAGATDQRGLPRRVPASGRCDIGSVESSIVNPTLRAKIVATHHSHGWYRGRVTVKYTCKAGSARLTHRCPASTVFTSSSRNHQVTKTIHGADGGRATVTVRGIKLDNTKPRIRISGVVSGHTYRTVRVIHRACSDSLSGIATCTLRTHRHGATVDYVVTAHDKAGNVQQRKGTYFIRG